MDIFSILLIAVGLAMDAFAVSISCGIRRRKFTYLYSLKIAFSFGIFQAVMPILGFFAGTSLNRLISSFDHWIAFALLSAIGIKMILESFEKEKTCPSENDISFRSLMLLSTATSIDALAVGISFALLNINILFPAIIIGIVAFTLSFAGVYIGDRAGVKLKTGSEFIGGLILIGIGLKILLEHIL